MISVIIPVYNVAEYISQCLKSILTQTYMELEIILIDDGSTDASGEICDEYARKDSRIKVIHQKNKGAAAAKNAGLQAATGEYLSFVDSDDFLEPDAYRYMVDLIRKYDVDIVQCSYRDVFKNYAVEHILQRTILNQIDFLALFTEDWTCALLWDKLYKKTLFDGILFETGHKIDDEYFTYLGVMNAEKILRDNHIVYNYRKRASSVMYSPSSAQQIISDRIDYLVKRKKNVVTRFPQLRSKYDDHFLNMMLILSREENVTEEHLKLIRGYLKRYFQEKQNTRPDYRLLPSLVKLMLFGRKKGWSVQQAVQLPNDGNSFFE